MEWVQRHLGCARGGGVRPAGESRLWELVSHILCDALCNKVSWQTVSYRPADFGGLLRRQPQQNVRYCQPMLLAPCNASKDRMRYRTRDPGHALNALAFCPRRCLQERQDKWARHGRFATYAAAMTVHVAKLLSETS